MKCKACYGKGNYSFYGNKIVGNKILPMGLHTIQCPRCNGTGEEKNEKIEPDNSIEGLGDDITRKRFQNNFIYH